MTVRTILQALAGPLLVGIVLGLAILTDQIAEPLRDPRKPFVVVNARTYRQAQRRLERLDPDEDREIVWALMRSICLWLSEQVSYGRRRRRVQRAAELEQWELRLSQHPLVPLA